MINIDNFYKASIGLFEEIDKVPEGFDLFFNSNGSLYFTNKEKTKLVRVSDHWGSGIRYCNWYLKERRNNNCELFQKFNNNPGKLIGIIDFENLVNVEHIYS